MKRYEILNANDEVIKTIVANSKEGCSDKIKVQFPETWPFVHIGKEYPMPDLDSHVIVKTETGFKKVNFYRPDDPMLKDR
jgi:hypothetical protein